MMHPWLEQNVYKTIESLKVRAALMGIGVQIVGTTVCFLVPRNPGPGLQDLMSFNAGDQPSEPQLEMAFKRACTAMDRVRGIVDHSWGLE